MTNFIKKLLGGSQVPSSPSIQPNVASVGGVEYGLGLTAQPVIFTEGYSDALMQTAVTGYNVPNPVDYFEAPVAGQILNVANIKASNSPSGKGCK